MQSHRRRSAAGVPDRLRLSGDPGGRGLRAQVSARHLAGASGHRQVPGRSCAARRRDRRSPRLHRQRQRSGALRARLSGAGARAEGDRALARVDAAVARRLPRLRRAARDSRGAEPREDPQPRPQSAARQPRRRRVGRSQQRAAADDMDVDEVAAGCCRTRSKR